MKITDFKIGETYLYDGQYEEKVLHIIRQQKKIVTINLKGEVWVFEENELENFKPLKEELPEEGLLVSERGALIYRTGESSGYGFYGDYVNDNDWSFIELPKVWRKATKQEEEKFIEMLKIECEKRGLYEDTKIEKHADGTSLTFPDRMEYEPTFNSKAGWNKNGQIFYKGKFATPRKQEETTLTKIANVAKKLGDFTIEQTESGIIILTPIKK